MFGSLKTRKTALVIVTAIILAYISAKFLPQGNPLVTLPWGMAGIIFGVTAKNKREALTLGGSIGFLASYAYLWFDDTSKLTLSKIVFLAFLILLPSLFGFFCGLLSSWIGWAAKKHFAK